MHCTRPCEWDCTMETITKITLCVCVYLTCVTDVFFFSENFIKQEPVEKKRRGRPPKLGRGSELFVESKKSKHGEWAWRHRIFACYVVPTTWGLTDFLFWLKAPRGTHLWEFIRDILIHPEKNPGLMKWEDRRDGVFKFLKSEAVAQLWGQKKKNSSMTYEKLSRAMRWESALNYPLAIIISYF